MVELHAAYWRKQIGTLTAQAEEVRELSTNVTADATEAFKRIWRAAPMNLSGHIDRLRLSTIEFTCPQPRRFHDDAHDGNDDHVPSALLSRGVDRELPPADYRVVTDEELIEACPSPPTVGCPPSSSCRHCSARGRDGDHRPLDLRPARPRCGHARGYPVDPVPQTPRV
jgi:hypothetical protein